jgi:multiple antibiotic resistance protein
VAEHLEFFLVALSAVFFVVDPIGIVPIFLSMTAKDPRAKVKRMALRASVVGGCLLAFFGLFGSVVFQVFGVSLSAFRVAGGLLLLMTALDMLRAKPSATRTSAQEQSEGEEKEDVSIVPLAMPLLAGPGAIASVMVLNSKGHGPWSAIPLLLSIAITFVATYFILSGAVWVQRVLRQSGVAILERVMGLLLAAIAVQFIFEGSRDLLKLGS